MLDLMLVIRGVKVAEGPRDQAIRGKLPSLESADAHAMTGSTGARVRPQKRPMENRTIALNDEMVQEHAHVGECGHEFLGSLGDRASAHRRNSAVNRERTFR